MIERRGASQIITRDCISQIRPTRTDIPPDHYEGCRPAVRDERLAHYVNNSIKEYDIRKDYYNDITFCFCFLDHRCNDARSNMIPSISMVLVSVVGVVSLMLFL